MMRRGLAGFRIPLSGLCWLALLVSPAQGRIQVFILAGQSNMEGKAKVTLLESQLRDPETRSLFLHLQKGGKWIERQDVWIKFLDRKGELTVGYGSPGRMGPELGFGWTVGEQIKDKVLLIKTAWGGKSLYWDFRPPGAGDPAASVLEQRLAQAQKKNSAATLTEIKASVGASYRAMLEEVTSTLKELSKHFPKARGQRYELAGLVWFQGWNDMISEEFTAQYADNMAHFIRDVRRDLDAPALPVIIGQLGVGGVLKSGEEPKRVLFKEAQAATADLAEFRTNVRLVRTDQYWDTRADAVFKKGWKDHLEEWEKVGSDYPFHYLGSPRTYLDIGVALGEAMLELVGE
jgi:alpha-galactosidase